MKPRVLLIALDESQPIAARLAGALARAEMDVGALAATDSIVARSRFLNGFFAQPAAFPGVEISPEGLIRAQREWQPQWLIPCDGRAVKWLNRLRAQGAHGGGLLDESLIQLIDRSLGLPMDMAQASGPLMSGALARRFGALAPITQSIRTVAQAEKFSARVAWPLVFREINDAGLGAVKLCRDPKTVAQLIGSQGLFSSLWERVMPGPVQARWLVQQHIPGRHWMCGFFADGGAVMAALCCERKFNPALGRGTLSLDFQEQPQLRRLTQELVLALGVSGFGCAEAIIDPQGRLNLTIFRPYPPLFAHLGAELGPDLCAALLARLKEITYRELPLKQPSTRVALFPQTLERDPSGLSLQGVMHDMPRDDERVLDALKSRLPLTPALSQALANRPSVV